MNQEKASKITGQAPSGEQSAFPAETVLLFAKYPEPGRVKTRLAVGLGNKAAVALHGLFVKDMVSRLAAGRFHVTLCHSPASSGPDFARMFPGVCLAPQEGRDLGEKMKNAFQRAFSQGAHAAVCMGTDVPDVPLSFVQKAFSCIRQGNPAIGPALDGGYYLIGFPAGMFAPEAFSGITWGSAHVFSRTMENLRSLGLAPEELPFWRDVDNMIDLAELKERQKKDPVLSENTLAMLEQIC